MLIRAYGTHWNPEIVNWGSIGRGNQGELKGRVRIDGEHFEVDFWKGKGVYVLHEDYKTVYVGQAFGTELGPRLRCHLTDRLTDRWNMFSWFSLSTVNKTTGTLRSPGQRTLDPKTVNDTLEALAILVTDPPLNRRQESLPDALEAEQLEESQPLPIREHLLDIREKLDEIGKLVVSQPASGESD